MGAGWSWYVGGLRPHRSARCSEALSRLTSAAACRAHEIQHDCSTPLGRILSKLSLTRACLYGRGACANFTLQSAALIKTKPTEWTRTQINARQFQTVFYGCQGFRRLHPRPAWRPSGPGPVPRRRERSGLQTAPLANRWTARARRSRRARPASGGSEPANPSAKSLNSNHYQLARKPWTWP